MQRLVISTEHPFLSSRLSEANGEIWLFDPDTCRFLDCALRAPLEMTKKLSARNDRRAGRDGRFLDSALRAPLEMTKNSSLEMTGGQGVMADFSTTPCGLRSK